jgi:hypothetical protein
MHKHELRLDYAGSRSVYQLGDCAVRRHRLHIDSPLAAVRWTPLDLPLLP